MGPRAGVHDRRRAQEVAAAGLVELTLVHPFLEDMKVCLAHHAMRPLGTEQFDQQFTLGPEPCRYLPGVAQAGQLRLSAVEPAGGGDEPGGLLGVLQQGADDDPVVGADRGGPVGAACRVRVEGAGSRDVGTTAVDLGVIAGPDMEAVTEASGGVLQELDARAGSNFRSLGIADLSWVPVS
jgi:hypothetical protein